MATLLSLLTSVIVVLFFFALALASHNKHNDDLQSSLTLPLMSVFNSQQQQRSKTKTTSVHTILQIQSNDQERLTYLSSLARGNNINNNIPIAYGKKITNNPTYIVQVNIGTPPQTLLMAIDTSHGTALVPCADCTSCSNEDHAFYSQSMSKTFKSVNCSDPLCLKAPTPPNQRCRPSTAPCAFRTTYGASGIKANLVQDSISLAADSIAKYTFGCVYDVIGTSAIPAQGMLGLGPQPLSLLSQTSDLYKSTFSYCLPSYKSYNFSGSLKLGPNNQPKNIVKTTPLRARSSFYYVKLRGIMVDDKALKITPYKGFEFRAGRGIPTLFDSGTVYSVLVHSAYNALRNEIRSRMKNLNARMSYLGGFDTCYHTKIDVTNITLMFPGMNMNLTQDNFVIQSSSGNLSCLAMSSALSTTSFASGTNVIGTYQQQNYRVLFDVPNSKLGVAPENCS